MTTSASGAGTSGQLGRGPIIGLRLNGPIERVGEDAALAERAGLDFVLLGDPAGSVEGPVGADPLSLAAFLMTTTQRIGLVACVADDWAPFNVARALASFDLLSGGRCGWVALRAPGAEPARSEEHLDVVLQLFDSWEDEALVFDKEAAVFADRTKVHRIRHAGAFYTVDGPLNAPRPPQGWPVLVQPVSTAGAAADIVLADFADLGDETRRRAGDARLVAHARSDLAVETGAALGARLADAWLAGLCDGFLVDAAVGPRLAPDIIPALEARGIVAAGSAAGDLRTRLGLSRPANRFAGQVGP